MGAGAVKVVGGSMDFEVGVAFKVVGEKAEADLEGDEFAGEGEEVFLGGGQEIGGGGEVAADQGFKHGKFHADFGEVELVFLGGAGGGADHVAEIVEGEAGHDGVEVDDADAFAGGVVEHDVVEFGVVVGDALGEIGVKQNAGHGLILEGEFDLGFGGLGAVGGVAFDGFFEVGEAGGGVMEIGDGVVEARGGEIGEEFLELTESLGGLKGLGGGFDGVEGAGVFDEDVNTPIVGEVVAMKAGAVIGGDEGEGTSGIGRGGGFSGNMGGDALDVIHERDGVLKNGVVDALENKAGGPGGLLENHAISVIDVPGAVGFGGKELAGNLKVARDGADIVFKVHAETRWEHIRVFWRKQARASMCLICVDLGGGKR